MNGVIKEKGLYSWFSNPPPSTSCGLLSSHLPGRPLLAACTEDPPRPAGPCGVFPSLPNQPHAPAPPPHPGQQDPVGPGLLTSTTPAPPPHPRALASSRMHLLSPPTPHPEILRTWCGPPQRTEGRSQGLSRRSRGRGHGLVTEKLCLPQGIGYCSVEASSQGRKFRRQG